MNKHQYHIDIKTQDGDEWSESFDDRLDAEDRQGTLLWQQRTDGILVSAVYQYDH